MTADQASARSPSFLRGRAGTGSLVVLVDDIQWAEPALLELLVRLPRLLGAPVFVLCLARPELLEHRPDWPVDGRSSRSEPLVDALLENLDAPAGGEGTDRSGSRREPAFRGGAGGLGA